MREATTAIRLAQEFVFWTVVTISALLLSSYVPFLGIFLIGIIASPMVIFSARYDTFAGVFLVLAVSTLLSLQFGAVEGLIFFCEFGTLSQALAYSIRRNLSHEKTILIAFLVVMASMAVFLIAVNTQLKGENLDTYIKRQITDHFSQTVKVYDKMEIKHEQKEQFKALAERSKSIMLKTYWGLYAGFTLLTIVVNLFVCERLLTMLGYRIQQITPFNRFVLSEHLVWGFIAGAGVVAVTSFIPIKPDIIQVIGLNLLLLFLFFYLVQGAAILVFWWEKIQLPKYLMFMTFFIMAIYPAFGLLILISFGLFDNWFDFRKIKHNPIV